MDVSTNDNLHEKVNVMAESSSCVHGQGTLASQCLSLQPGQ